MTYGAIALLRSLLGRRPEDGRVVNRDRPAEAVASRQRERYAHVMSTVHEIEDAIRKLQIGRAHV